MLLVEGQLVILMKVFKRPVDLKYVMVPSCALQEKVFSEECAGLVSLQ